MDFADKSGKYYEILAPIVEGLGFSIVELTASNRQDGLHIALVIYSDGGIGIKDCERVHRMAAARMEVVSDMRDVYFEVSSPGVNRNIKSADEFAVFKGRRIKILTSDSGEWIYGDLVSADSNGIMVEVNTNIDNKNNEKTVEKILYSLIKKAKLDFFWKEA